MGKFPFSVAATVLGLLSFSASACYESTGPAFDLVGVYTLYTVNSEPKPFLVGESEGHSVEVLEGRIDVRADQTCEFYHAFRLTSFDNAEVTDRVERESCTWSSNDVAIHLRFSDNGSISGATAPNSLWFDFNFEQGPMRFAYFRGTPLVPPN